MSLHSIADLAKEQTISPIGGTNSVFKYQPSGTEQKPFALSLNDLNPRGVASNATGTTQWVVDANKNVYVYSPSGTQLGKFVIASRRLPATFWPAPPRFRFLSEISTPTVVVHFSADRSLRPGYHSL